MSSTRAASTGWERLEAAIAGEVVHPGSAAYEEVRTPAVPRFGDVRPAAVVRCRQPGDVAAAIAFARRAGLPIAVRSGGHCFAWRSSSEGIVIDLAGMHAIRVVGPRATIGAGARLGDVYAALDAHGRTLPAGCGPTVGIAGLTLGGGLGILGRLHGLTCDALRAAEVVLADGRVACCDARDGADLFWALRGAGGARFAVVTALVFETVPAPAATAFELRWPAEAATALVDAWQRWSPDAPDRMAASLLLGAGGEDAGAPVARVFGAMVAGAEETAAQLGALAAAAGAEPASSRLDHGPFRGVKRFLAGLGEVAGDDAVPSSRSEFFARALPRTTIAGLVRHLLEAPADGHRRELDFTPWGGAYTRVAPDATAFAHRSARFLLKHGVAVRPTASRAQRAAAGEWLARSWALTHGAGTGGVYPNFPEAGLDPWSSAYHGANRERLLSVKRRYDPEGVFGP